MIQKTDKLMLLAKADRNVMGVQLLTLLGYDNQSEKGRNALRKNAFALMRLQKYRYAIATFLYASPPMLKEACSVACKQLNDPFLALFIARYTEFQQGCSGCPGGLILGPCSRSVISQHILPTITDWIKERYNNKNMNTSNVQLSTNNTVDSSSKWHGIRLPSFLDNISDRHIDISTLALVCTLWLQDVSLFQNTLQLCLQYQSLCIGDTADRVIYKTNLLDSNDKLEVYLNRIYNMTSLCSVIHWLRSLPIQFMSITLLEKVFFEFQSAVSSYGIMHESIEVYRVFESHKTNLTGQPRTHDINYDKQGYFFEYCKDVCNRWKEWAKTAPIVSESISDGLIVDITESGSTDTQAVQDVDEEDDDVKIARLRLSKLTATTVETIPATSSTSSTSSGIADKSNTAAESSVSIPTPPIKSGLFNLAKTNLATSPTSTAATASSPASALDMFDMPTERPVRVKIASEPTTAKSALDIFDMPIERPQRVKPVLVEPSSDPVIRADTTVKPVTVALTQTTPNAWDIFDEPIQRPPRQTK